MEADVVGHTLMCDSVIGPWSKPDGTDSRHGEAADSGVADIRVCVEEGDPTVCSGGS